MLVSRKHPIRYYGVILLTFVFLTVFPAGIIWIITSLYETDSRMAIFLGTLFLLFGLPAVVFGAVHTYKGYLKTSSNISLNKHEIAFDEAVYPLSEIQFICLTGKPPLGKYNVTLEEAAAIKFRNGDMRYIFDNIYVNAWEFKFALEQIIQQEPTQISKIDKVPAGEVSLLDSREFSGSQWTSFHGIMLWGTIGFFTLLGISVDTEAGWLVIFPFITFWYLFFGNQMNYFMITTDRHLVILNHAFPFRQKELRLSDIREVTFENQSKSPTILRIITKDFRSKLYPAATLRTQHWFDLKIALEEHGIFVRNECIQDFGWDLETIEQTSYERSS